jgi:hypothetical protein
MLYDCRRKTKERSEVSFTAGDANEHNRLPGDSATHDKRAGAAVAVFFRPQPRAQFVRMTCYPSTQEQMFTDSVRRWTSPRRGTPIRPEFSPAPVRRVPKGQAHRFRCRKRRAHRF